MRSELKKLHVDVGATTVYVTHDQVEAMSMGDRVVVMNLGVLQQIGTPQEVYAHPKNLFVANFIGSPGMNFIDVVPIKDSNGHVVLMLKTLGVNIVIPEKLQKLIIEKGKIEKNIVLGVRPEDVSIEFKETPNYVKSEVFVIETLGSYNIIDMKIGNEIVRVRTLPVVMPDFGTEAFIGVDMDRVTLFDKETEKSIM